jgi:hypothetical protein
MKINEIITEAKKANTKTARAEFGRRASSKPKLSDREQEKKKADSDDAWARLMAHIEAEKKKELNEFAADDGGDSGEEDALRKYASMWCRGNEQTQLKIEAVLARAGWEIGEDEGGYDNGGVFVVQSGDENGKSYMSWSAEDLDGISEGKTGPGLWANIHAKQERIKHGSGERMRKPGSKGAPTNKNFKDAANEDVTAPEDMDHSKDGRAVEELRAALENKRQQIHSADSSEVYDIIDEIMTRIAKSHGISGQKLHDMWVDKYKEVPDTWIMETAAWQRKEGKNKKGGLNQKGVDSYRREHPGSKLQTAVTTKPSKLKAGSKDAKRRKSFCARMSGVDGPMKDENGKPTRKALALKKWNC